MGSFFVEHSTNGGLVPKLGQPNKYLQVTHDKIILNPSDQYFGLSAILLYTISLISQAEHYFTIHNKPSISELERSFRY